MRSEGLPEFLLARFDDLEATAIQMQNDAVRGSQQYKLGELLVADVAARRPIVNYFAAMQRLLTSDEQYRVERQQRDTWHAQREALRFVLELFSVPFAGHPDYRDEWRPAS